MATRATWAVTIIAALMAISWWTVPAHALPCTTSEPLWNPDPSVSNATPCGVGTVDNNGNAETFNGTPFTLWDTDQAGEVGNTDLGLYFTATSFESGPGSAPTGGFWFWNATNSLAAGNDIFALVLKDGGVDGSAKWAWFILENPAGSPGVNAVNWKNNPITAGSCDDNEIAGTQFTHCGTWSMYGKDGTPKALSHMSIYGADRPDTPRPPQAVPVPATLILLGLGFGVVASMRLTRRPSASLVTRD